MANLGVNANPLSSFIFFRVKTVPLVTMTCEAEEAAHMQFDNKIA